MTKNTIGTPNYFREILAQVEEELAEGLDGASGKYCYPYAYGRLLTSHKFAIAQLEQALENARPQCRPGCGRLSGHSGPCIERDLDAEINAGKWGIDYVTDPSKWGCANALDPATWPGDPEVECQKLGSDKSVDSYDIDSLGEFLKRRKVIAEKWNDPEFVNVNHE